MKHGGHWKRLWFLIGDQEEVKEAIQTVFEQIIWRVKVPEPENAERKTVEQALVLTQ
jgi:hypothetical protein